MRLLSIVVAGCVAIAAAGCGGGDKKPATTATTTTLAPGGLQGANDPAAQAAAQRYVDAYTAKDAAAICSALAQSVRTQLAGSKGCAATIRKTLIHTYPKLTAKRSYVNGDTAIVTFQGSPRQVTVQREQGDWRVVNGGT